jgi:hypothetical protein
MKHLAVKLSLELLLQVAGVDIPDMCPEWDVLVDSLLLWVDLHW